MTDLAAPGLARTVPLAEAWARLSEMWLAERPRWILWLPVCFASGIAVYFYLTLEPPLWLGLTLASFGAAALLLAALLRRMLLVVLLAPLAAACGGFLAAEWRSIAVEAPMLRHATSALEVTGRVTRIETTKTGRRILLDQVKIAGWPAERTPESVRVVARGNSGAAAAIGGFIATRATLAPPPPPAAPDAFDIQRLMYFRGIGGLGRTLGAVRAIPAPAGYQPDITIRLAIARADITTRIARILPGDTGAVAAALITGDRTTISDPVLQDMRNSGLAHLIAISGLNVALVAGFVLMLVRGALALVPPIALRYPTKKWAAMLALVAVVAYCVLSGLEVPVLRALIMFALAMLAIMIDRAPISMRVFAIAALLVLAVEPEALAGASFQMSFGAVAALIAAYEAVQPWFTRQRQGAGWLRKLALAAGAVVFTSLVATIANAPFSAFHFDRVALYGILANLVAVPLTGVLIMPAAVFALMLMPFGLESWGLLPMGWGVDIILVTAHIVAAWPGAVIAVPAMPVWSLALITLGSLWIFFWLERWRWWGLAAIAAGIVLALATPAPDLLVSADGKLAAIRSEEGRLWLSRNASGLVAESWVARAGGDAPASFATAARSSDSPLACDGEGCVYRSGRHVIALAQTRSALEEDCRRATVLIALVPLRRACPAPEQRIDRFDLWRNGAHALWLEGDSVRVVSDRDRRGLRPWSQPPEPRNSAARSQ